MDFLASLLEMEPVKNPLPSGNYVEKLDVRQGRWRGAIVLYGDSEKSWVLWRGRHLHHVGVSLHHRLRTIGCDLGVDVPAETDYARRCAYPSNKLGRLHITESLCFG
jgi:hypothetical protein